MATALASLQPADLPDDSQLHVEGEPARPDPSQRQLAEIEQGDRADRLREWRHAVRLYALSRRPAGSFVSRRMRRWSWLLVLALHVLIVVLGRLVLRQTPPAPETSVMQVQLLDPQADEPQLPLPSPMPRRELSERATRTAPHTPATPMVVPTPVPAIENAPEVRPYNPDGSVNLPDDFAEQLDKARPKPDFIPLQVAPSPLFAAKRPLKVRPNHFAQYWDGTDGMPLHESMWRYVTATKEFTAPWGGRYGCTWVLVVVTCADIPDKAWNPPQTWKPATEFDER